MYLVKSIIFFNIKLSLRLFNFQYIIFVRLLKQSYLSNSLTNSYITNYLSISNLICILTKINNSVIKVKIMFEYKSIM